jgi:hypothetical protein
LGLGDIDMSLKHETFTLDLKLLLLKLGLGTMEVFEHLCVFILQEIDMLMRGLIVIVETANVGLLFVFHHFFAQDLEL